MNDAFLAHLKKHCPQATREIAAALGLDTNDVRKTGVRMKHAGLVRSEGTARAAQWHVAEGSPRQSRKLPKRTASDKLARNGSYGKEERAIEEVARAAVGEPTRADEELKGALQSYAERMMRRANLVAQLLEELGG